MSLTGAYRVASRFAAIPEAYLVLYRGETVLLLRRANTGYEDGNYGLVAGHVEAGETASEAMVREAYEEAGITIRREDLRLCHVTYRRALDTRIGFFFTTTRYEGEPENREPHKCSDLSWFAIDALPDNMVDYVRCALAAIARGEPYSEYDHDIAPQTSACAAS